MSLTITKFGIYPDTFRHGCKEGIGSIPLIGHVIGDRVKWGMGGNLCAYCGAKLPQTVEEALIAALEQIKEQHGESAGV